jgi:hypothetical protein
MPKKEKSYMPKKEKKVTEVFFIEKMALKQKLTMIKTDKSVLEKLQWS